jgi:hypothetical protein
MDFPLIQEYTIVMSFAIALIIKPVIWLLIVTLAQRLASLRQK